MESLLVLGEDWLSSAFAVLGLIPVTRTVCSMQSLRKKSQASAPAARPRKNTLKGDKDARKSRVGDKIKKRMSTRYADMPESTSIPDVPALPIRAIRTADDAENIFTHGQRDTRSSAILVDLAAMQLADFDPDACALVPN